MKILRVLLSTLIIGTTTLLLLSCASEADSAPSSENQAVTVQRGNLSVDITAVGNLALSVKEDLAFDIFYPETTRENKATVAEVLVEEGESVEAGQVLAVLDASEWKEQLDALKDAVTAAERQLATKERDLTQKKLDLLNAKIALEDAEALYVWPAEIFAARATVRSAENEVEEIQAVLDGGKIVDVYSTVNRSAPQFQGSYFKEAKTAWDIKVWTQYLADAKERLQTARVNLDELLAASAADAKVTAAEKKLRTAQVRLDELLAETIPDTVAERVDREKEIEVRRMKVELAQQQLEDARKKQETVATQRLKVELAQGKLEDATVAVADAQEALEDAQRELNEANGKSPVITAPFAGFITKVNVSGGDEVLTGTVAVQLADPTKFEAEIMVSEMDIFRVKLGGTARVQVDAMPGLELPAEVTHISPTATIQQGVVNYKVKVEVKPLKTVTQEKPKMRQDARPDMSPGELPERPRRAIEEGRIAQEQAGERVRPRQQGKDGLPQREPKTQRGQSATTAPEDLQLREGLTVTVSIIVKEATDVLLVPNSAVTTRRGETTVKVLKDGVTEERAIKAGISNFQFTEVVEGLSEGEQIITPQGAATSTRTTQQQGQRQGDVQGQMRRMLR